MARFGSGSAPASPQIVPTDTIIPFHDYDDTDTTNGLSFDFTFRFDDLLDDERLRVALSRLLELGDWRKLGARIRRNDAGALEYHVPKCFDDKRPGFAYSTATFDVAVDEHPQASRLAQPHSLDTAGRPVVFKGPSYVDSSGFKSFIRNPGFPERLSEWLYTDSPQLGVHVIHFQDATLVTLSFLHSLTDMMGLSAIFDAWTMVLNGEEDQVKPFLGFSDDPMRKLSQMKLQPSVKYRHADMLLTGWRLILLAVTYYLSIEIFWPRREEERIIFLPAKHLIRMRGKAMEELVTQATTNDEKASFVSEADVIFAWWTRIVMRAEKPSPNRTINMRNTCCSRSILEELNIIPSAASALVTNAVFGIITFLEVQQVLERSIAFTASEIRKALIEERKAEQLHALDALSRDSRGNKRSRAHFRNPNMFMIMISNWEKAKLYKVDFSAAVVRQGLSVENRNNELGRPSSIQGSGTRNYATRNTGAVIGKDAGGNYWLSYNLRKEAWLAVERDILHMSEEGDK
jgi:hypothetical protein